MSLHRDDWERVLEEIKQDLPWLLSLWHQIKSGSDKPVKDVEVVQIGNAAYDVGVVHHDGNTANM